LTLEDTVKPQLVFFIEGATKAGKKENAIVEVDEISKPVEYVTDECAKTPKETVWKKVENYVKKATKKL